MGLVVVLSLACKLYFYLNDSNWAVMYTNTLARMDTFAIGGLVAYAAFQCPKEQWLSRMKYIGLASLSIVLVYALSQKGLIIFDKLGHLAVMPFMALFFATVLYLSVHGSGESRYGRAVLKLLILRLLGKYSYGIYIYHWIIWATLIELNAFGMKMENAYMNFGMVLAITLIVSLLSYHLIEAPFLRLKKKLR